MTLNMRVPTLGIAFLLERIGTDCTPLQYLREILQNCIDSFLRNGLVGEIIIDVDPIYLAEFGQRKLCIIDNAGGMDGDELVTFINALSISGGTQANNANYGIGAKIAGGIANPEGMIFQSWKNGKGHMVQLWKDPDTGSYGLKELDPEANTPWLIEMDNAYKPEIIDQHGTKVILLGTCETADTTSVGDVPAGVERKKWVPCFLNNRYLKFPPNITIRSFPNDTWARIIKGMQHHLEEKSESRGKLTLTDATIHWWILKKDPTGKKNARGDACIETSHVAALYQNELYGLKTGNAGKSVLNQFGLIYGAKRVVIYAEPTDRAVTSDTARSLLKIDGQELPWDEWGTIFRDNMPMPLLELEESEAASSSSLANIDDIKRLLSNVMNYFKFSAHTPSKKGSIQGSDVNTAGVGNENPKNINKPDEKEGNPGKKKPWNDPPIKPRVKASSNPYLPNKTGADAVKAATVEISIPTLRWEEHPETDLINYAAKYHPTSNLMCCNRKFIGFVELHKRLVSERNLTGGMSLICRDAIEKWYGLSLTEAVVGIQCAGSQLGWDANNIETALSPEALTTICMQKHSQVSNIKRELGAKLGAH